MFGKPKILTEVISPILTRRKKFRVEGNFIIIREARRGAGGAGYKAEFDKDCLLPYHVGWGPFKQLKQKLLLIEGADRCISFHISEELAEVDRPSWDRYSLEKASEAEVIKAAGATMQKIQISPIFYILMFLIVGLQFITLLVASGKIRIG